jgi:APA family basic amino acid/polyamine antiporter
LQAIRARWKVSRSANYKSAIRRSRNQRSADSLVRPFLCRRLGRADKAVPRSVKTVAAHNDFQRYYKSATLPYESKASLSKASLATARWHRYAAGQTLPFHAMNHSQNPGETKRANEGLLPTLGLFTTITLVVGGVIGSGIFRKPGVMAAELGSPELLFGVWVLAGVITLFGALTNAEISSFITDTGGQYVFYERMYGPFFAYMYGWAVFAVIQTGSIAALAYVFAEYSTQFAPLPELTGPIAAFSVHLPFIGDIAPFKEIGVKGLAALVIITLTAINYIGVRFGGLVQNVFTIAKVAGMAALFLAAFLMPAGGSITNFTTSSTVIHKEGLALVAAIAAALQGAFWAYDGWSKITYIAGEVKEPQRNVPRATVIGMFIVTAIYLLLNVAYAYVLPVDVMAKSKLVAADVAEKCMSGGGRWIAAVVMASTFSAANANILATARVYFSMARRKVFPSFLGIAHSRFHTPTAALVVQCVWCIVMLFTGTFDTLTDTLIFVSWIFYAAGAYGVFVLRRKEPDAPRPYKVPGYPVVPWIFVIFAGAFLVLTIYNDITGYRAAVAAGKPGIINCAFGTFLVLIGTPIYFFYRMKQTKGGQAKA